MEFKSDIQIAQETVPQPITAISEKAGIDSRYLEQYGSYKAKVDYRILKDLADRPDGKLILVTAISPTPAGEGKTTTSVGLADALQKIGKNVFAALREPSMRILFLIARQFNQLMIVKEMAASGAGRDAIASTMKLRPFIAGKLLSQARAFTREQLKEYVELCVTSEEAVKRGNISEKLAVELVIVKISRR